MKADEPYIIDSAVGNFYGQDPLILGWPGSLIVLFLFILYFVYYLFLKLGGAVASVEDFIFLYWDDPSTLYLIGRISVAVCGALTIVALYRLAHRGFGRRTAILSALFLTFAFMHVRHSHFALPDVPMTLFLVLLVSLSLRLLSGAGLVSYFLAGALTGLAGALKYHALIIVVPLLLAHFLGGSGIGRDGSKKLGVLFGAVLVFFYIGCPYVLTDPKAVLDSTRIVVFGQKDIGNIRGIPTGPAFLYLFGTVLPRSIGKPMLFSALAGIVALLVTRRKKNFVLLSYPVIYIILLSTSRTIFLRYAIPLIPFMALFSAVFIAKIGERAGNSTIGRAAVIGLAALVVLPQAWTSVLFGHMLTVRDTRITARRWIVEQLPANSSIVLDHVPFSVPMGFNEWVFNYEMRDDRWGDLKYRYLEEHGDEKINTFDLTYMSGELPDEIGGDGPHFIIVSSYVRNLFFGKTGRAIERRMPEAFRERRSFYNRVEEEGVLLMRFAPTGVEMSGDGDVYGVDINPEPGPVIEVYRMRKESGPS